MQKKKKSNCKFVCCPAEELNLLGFKHPQLNWSEDWENTILLCLGHTLPHFEHKYFLDFIKKRKPRFLFIDFFHDFDKTIEKIQKNKQHIEREPKRIYLNNDIFCLTTSIDPENEKRVLRGIQKYTNNKKPETLFLTSQGNQQSVFYLDAFEEQEYIRLDTEKYHSGYGSMQSFFYSTPNNLAEEINELYFNHTSGFIQEICRKPHILGAMGLVNHRVAAVILPFDTHFTFAKYLAIAKDAEKHQPKTKMLVDNAYNIQSKFPTAHGIFMTILDQVSSANIIDVSKLKGAKLSGKDIHFRDKEEGPFFKASALQDSHSIKKLINPLKRNNDETHFFVMPFYVGSLPLFCLVVSFSDRLPTSLTDQRVYFAILENIANLVERELDVDVFATKVLHDFTNDAVSLLTKRHNFTNEKAAQLSKLMLTVAMKKKWKSWHLTLPSLTIDNLALTKDQNKKLINHWKARLRYALSDNIRRLSDWFSAGSFFENDPDSKKGHNELNEVHKRRLRTLLKKAQSKSIESLNRCKYFDVLKDSKELKWTINKLITIQDCNIDDEKAIKSFDYLKHVFCTSEAGKGDKYRFSPLRLVALCSMFTLNDDLVKCPTISHALLLKHSLVPIANKDYTKKIVNLVSSFHSGTIDGIKLLLGTQNNLLECTLSIQLKKYFTAGSEGSDFGEIKKILNILGSYDPDVIRGFNKLTLKFTISPLPREDAKDGPFNWIMNANDKPCLILFEGDPGK